MWQGSAKTSGDMAPKPFLAENWLLSPLGSPLAASRAFG